LAVVSGQTPTRDIALLHVLNGTGMMANEVAQLEVADLLDEDGESAGNPGCKWRQLSL
jgi:site-specific recombinase XerD